MTRSTFTLFVVPLLLVASLASGAKCFPAGSRVVIFINGIYTGYDDATGTSGHTNERNTFSTLKTAFVEHGYKPETLLDYSYNGGHVTPDGGWLPDDYACADTDRSSEQSLAVLERMLRDYKAAHPQAHFTLLGHSYGGYLAFLEGAREAARTAETKLDIDVVVTLDSPLRGISADKRQLIDVLSCRKTYAAGSELVAEKAGTALIATRAAQVALMHEQGVRLATIGNSRDCLYASTACGLPVEDETESQILPGADLAPLHQIAATAIRSHFVILVRSIAVDQVVEFVGAP